MADELQLQFDVASPPATVMQEWRLDPPKPFRGFELADESFNSLT
jgi:hypothetical protein